MTRIFVYEWTCANPGAIAPGSSLIIEGAAMRAAVLADFADVPDVTAITIDDEAEYRSAAASADFALVVAPETGRILEEHCRTARDAGAILLGPSPEAVALTADKLALARLWEAADVPTPPTYSCVPPIPPPWVVKPRDGCGSAGMALADAVPDGMIAQPYIRGIAASVAFIVGDGQLVPLVPSAQHLDDAFRYLGGCAPLPPALGARAVTIARRAVAAVPGLAGYVGVDVVLGDDGRDWAIEINPRLSTSYVGQRALALANIAELMLKAVRRAAVHPPQWREVRVTWTADGQVLPP